MTTHTDNTINNPSPKKRSFGIDAIAVAISRVVIRFSTLIIGIVVARVLGPENRGLIAALTVPTNLSTSFAEMGMRESAAYHIGNKIFTPREVVATLLSALPMTATLSIGLSMLYFQLTGIAVGDWFTRTLAVAVVPFSLGTAYMGGVLLGTGSMRAFARANWVPSIIALTTVCIFTWGLEAGVRGILFSAALSTAFGFFFALFVVSREIRISFHFSFLILRRIQSLGLTYAVAAIALLLNYKIMILLLTHLSTLNKVGIYVQAAAIAEIIWEIPMVVSSLIFSRTANASCKEEMSYKILSLLRVTIIFVTLIAVGIGIAAPFIFPVIYGADFSESAPLCIILLPGVVAFVIYRILMTDVHGRGLARYSIVVIVPTLATSAILGYFFILSYGVTGAAIASTLTYILAGIAYTIMYSRITGIRVKDILVYKREDFVLAMKIIPQSIRRRIKLNLD